MKALSVFVAATIMAGTCSACPNLSGRYRLQGEDGQVLISIQQKGCTRITIVRENWYLGTVTSETHALVVNGVSQQDNPWLGLLGRTVTSARFAGAELRVMATAEGDSPLTMIYSLTRDRDLLESSGSGFEGERRGLASIAKRERR